MNGFPIFVKIVEVSPRDGLQNEKNIIPAAIKIEFINQLSDTGLSVIEATSFVSPKWIPQLGDHKEVFEGIQKKSHISYPVLVPNIIGLHSAIEAGVKEIAVFTTPSEQFSKRNTNCSVKESMENIQEVITVANKHHIKVRGYLSCVLGSPYEDEIQFSKVADLAAKLISLGCYEVSLGDTIGTGTPIKTKNLLETVIKKVPAKKIAVHFHDTYGQALVNIYVALTCGIAIIDSSVGGLGGCPYAKGASGNVATEDVLYMLNGMGIKTNIDFKKIMKASDYILSYLNKSCESRVHRAQKLEN